MADQSAVAEGLELLSSILQREQSRGRETVAVSESAEEVLRTLPITLMQRAQEAPSMTAEPAAVASEPRETARSARPSGNVDSGSGEESKIREELNRIFKQVKNCETCRSLGTLRETVVFATGNPMADLMFVGEAPGAEEEKERKPFVGPAGQKLTAIIKAMGLSREDVYISNIVKYRPKKGDGRFQGSGNRKPTPIEMEASIGYLRQEIALVQPKVIVALGGTAAEGLLEESGTISAMRRQDHEFEGVPVIVTYHPSYLLRQESEPEQDRAKAAKRMVWEDMLKAMERLGMEISERQQGYFL